MNTASQSQITNDTFIISAAQVLRNLTSGALTLNGTMSQSSSAALLDSAALVITLLPVTKANMSLLAETNPLISSSLQYIGCATSQSIADSSTGSLISTDGTLQLSVKSDTLNTTNAAFTVKGANWTLSDPKGALSTQFISQGYTNVTTIGWSSYKNTLNLDRDPR